MIDSDSSVIRPITLFSDEPTSEDKFGTHKVIAKTLNEIIDFEHKKKHEIKKPFVVGLFGKWGSGKSSIIQMLKDNIKNHSIVEVDAWSVGSRHFPRQVIRCCAEQLNIAENKRVKELLPDIEKEEQVDDVEWKPSKAAGMFATIFIIVVVGLVILSFYDMYYKKDWPLEVVTPLIITALAFWFIS